MRDIKSIRGEMFAHGVPFELLDEYADAIRDEPAQDPSEEGRSRLKYILNETNATDTQFLEIMSLYSSAQASEKMLRVLYDAGYRAGQVEDIDAYANAIETYRAAVLSESKEPTK